MGNQSMIGRPSIGLIVFAKSCNRVRHAMGKMTACISESDSCKHARKHQGFKVFVFRVVYGRAQILAHKLDRLQAGDITVRIRSLA